MQRSFVKTAGFLLIVFAISITYWIGCDTHQDLADISRVAPALDDNTLSKDNPRVQAVMAVQEKFTADIMADRNVAGTATGLTDDGRLAIMVYLKTESSVGGRGIFAKGLPPQIEGIPVVTEVTGEFRAMKGGGVSHTAKQTPPIQLGTSGGWRYDLANGFCCGGTLGSLVKIGSTQYILSNYHVLEADIVNGGNNRVAQAGDPVIQPGLIDVGCNANNAQDVATLSGIKSLPGSNVDAAIAQVISGMVSTNGAILEIGTLSANTVNASLSQAVKKSGRTTGLTRSSVSGLNATVNITYSNECAGGTSFTKTFTGQIVINNKGSKFLNSGDSGSQMVEDITTNPRSVGLLYAGSSLSAIANPIGEVLSFFGASMVGQ